MMLAVMEMFEKNNVVVYSIPTHTSGKLQPLDVVTFAVFKSTVDETLASVVGGGTRTQLNMYNICEVLRSTYFNAFTHDNICSSFRRIGIWSLDSTRLFNKSCPNDSDDIGTLLVAEALVQMYEEQRMVARRTILGEDVNLLRNGNVNTRRGSVLTSAGAIRAARDKSQADELRIERERAEKAECELRLAHSVERRRSQREKV